jgi:hypothetical protein
VRVGGVHQEEKASSVQADFVNQLLNRYEGAGPLGNLYFQTAFDQPDELDNEKVNLVAETKRGHGRAQPPDVAVVVGAEKQNLAIKLTLHKSIPPQSNIREKIGFFPVRLNQDAIFVVFEGSRFLPRRPVLLVHQLPLPQHGQRFLIELGGV